MRFLFMTVLVFFLGASISYGQNFESNHFQPRFIKDKREHHPEELEKSMKRHGRWIQIPETGYGWRPNDVPPRWNPIREGHRVWNPVTRGYVMEYPERPWGWLPIDEGRWHLYAGTGWVWIPNQTLIAISPDGISLHLSLFDAGMAPVPPPPPPAYYPEEEEHTPRGHAYGYYRHHHENDEEGDDD